MTLVLYWGLVLLVFAETLTGNQRVVGWNFGMELGIFNKFGEFRGLNCSRQQNTYVSDGNKKIKS